MENFLTKYSFMNFVMTEYCHEKFNLSVSEEEERYYLDRALNYARDAVKKNKSNLGILHSFSVAVALALENKVEVSYEDFSSAMENVNRIIEEKPDYGGIYYATRARLLSQLGDYKGALKNIRYAQALEKPDHDDWILRIANYQRYEVMIRMKMAGESPSSI